MGDLPGGGVFLEEFSLKFPFFPLFHPIPTQPRVPVFRASGMRIPLGIGAPGIFLNLFFQGKLGQKRENPTGAARAGPDPNPNPKIWRKEGPKRGFGRVGIRDREREKAEFRDREGFPWKRRETGKAAVNWD